MSKNNFIRLQKTIYQLSPVSSLQAINHILENYKEVYPSADQATLLWCTLYAFLKENPSKELDYCIFAYMNEIETKNSTHFSSAKEPKVA